MSRRRGITISDGGVNVPPSPPSRAYPRGVFREPSTFDGHSTFQVVASTGRTIARLDVANGCPCTSLIDGLWSLLDHADPVQAPRAPLAIV